MEALMELMIILLLIILEQMYLAHHSLTHQAGCYFWFQVTFHYYPVRTPL